ncbi:cytochrome C552 [Methylobacterium sp. Leaf117]|nr:cytochrome C552 [Methylobacterium sp. Leaf117]
MTGTVVQGWGLGIVAVLSLAIAQPAMAEPVKNHRIRGWTLVAENCGGCHVVGGGLQEGGYIGPAFSALAAMPSTTGMSLNILLQSHHRTMPSVRLDRDEMDAIIDYILSLKAAEPAQR